MDARIPTISGRTGSRAANSVASSTVDAVWQVCALRRALGENADWLLADAREEVFQVGEVVYGAGRPPFILIVEGLARVYCCSPQGRQATIRYATPGDVVGLPFVLAPQLTANHEDLAVQALSWCRVLHFSPSTFRRVAESDARCMWPLFGELAESMVAAERLLSQNVFQPIRARVARHMLDLSEKRGDRLVVPASQRDIADAIGSVREVISRIIVQLRDDGLIRRGDGVYVIIDPEGLQTAAEQE